MKTTLIALIALFAASTAMAQVSSTSSNTSSTASTAGATNAGNAQQITFNSPNKVEYSGSYTARTTGNAVLPGFAGSFSGDYCGGTAGLAVGGPGFAVSGGAPKIDESCVMLRTFERVQQAAASDPDNAKELRSAALDILASIDPKIRAIFLKHKLLKGETETTTTNADGQQVYAVSQPESTRIASGN
ncbi:hypothetical protein [Caballeronia sp. LZ035]|uniref:hypothetical protein n=1 Tax=Caballeronia sp. LZ035 TaxID=3038568 RepID=UPI00285FF162|nr:hypothetical protein [Caballeronia sp. LZ035]MDR5756987.1 hypothetical protein [Caballeronia sp. LZ035]